MGISLILLALPSLLSIEQQPGLKSVTASHSVSKSQPALQPSSKLHAIDIHELHNLTFSQMFAGRG